MPEPHGGWCEDCKYQVSIIDEASGPGVCDSLEQANLEVAIRESEVHRDSLEQANLEAALRASALEAAQQAGSAHGSLPLMPAVTFQ